MLYSSTIIHIFIIINSIINSVNLQRRCYKVVGPIPRRTILCVIFVIFTRNAFFSLSSFYDEKAVKASKKVYYLQFIGDLWKLDILENRTSRGTVFATFTNPLQCRKSHWTILCYHSSSTQHPAQIIILHFLSKILI